MRTDRKPSHKADKKVARNHKPGVVIGYSKKSALLEEAITHMNSGKYGRSSAALKSLLALDPQNIEARRLFATLHLRLGSLVTAREGFESLANEAIGRQDYWLAESLLREYLAAGPRCIPFLELLAHVYEEKGDEMAAVAELGKAVEILLEDPDPENPKKPALLYSRIRELAPASPVAFRFASSFDIQTGEFLLPQRSAGNQFSPDNPEGTPVHSCPSSKSSTSPDVMPREQLDESPSKDSFTSRFPDSEGTTTDTPLDSFSLTKGAETTNWSPVPLPSVGQSDLSDPVSSPTADLSVRVSEIMACAEQESAAAVAEPAESSSLPFRLPWEHVADPALQSSAPQHANETVVPGDATVALPPTPTAFSWNAIFDSAWKFAVSTTTPNPSATLEEQAVTMESEPHKQPPVAPDSVEAGETDNAVQQPEAVQTENMVDASFNSLQQALPTYADTLPQADGIEVAVASTAPPLAIGPPLETPIQESIEKPPSFLAQPRSDEAAHPFIALPASFSVVVEEQIIPSSIAADDMPLESAETVPSQGVTDTGTTDPASAFSDAVVETAGVKEPHTIVKAPVAVDPPLEEKSTLFSPESPAQPSSRWDSNTQARAPVAVPEEIIHKVPIATRPEWAQASDAISVGQPPTPMSTTTWQGPVSDSFYTIDEPAPSAAVSTVNVLFGQASHQQTAPATDKAASPTRRPGLSVRLARIRRSISFFIRSCFSTTRAFTLLCLSIVVLCIVLAVISAGLLALAWIVIEERPTTRYQNLTTGPQRLITDHRKNGFLLLMGFDAPSGIDPIQAGYQRKLGEQDVAAARTCMMGYDPEGSPSNTDASSHVINSWFRRGDPVAHLNAQPATVKSLVVQKGKSLARYQQWLTMPFDDWGFGQILSPNCPSILLTHRLYVLDAFNQDMSVGISRLEKDMESWRTALGQSKTLMTKMLAATAVQDDMALASGLLTRSDTDAATVNRLAKMVRPLDQVELSVRWPMQSHFVWATRDIVANLKKDRTEEHPFYVSLAAAMPLPVQRRANAYADYYEAANRAVAEGRYVNLPKASQFMRTSSSNLLDYWANPIEHIVGIDPLPSWDAYVGRMIEIDAQLRLASLQAWVRRGPQDADVLARLAKAGQAYYDPFTGLPMLVNQEKRLLYSVGRDGKDQEGDRQLDVVVEIPTVQILNTENRRLSK